MPEDSGSALPGRSVFTSQSCKAGGEDRLARSTVLSHLKHLETDSLLAKEEIIQGKVGRPKMLYKPTAKLLEAAKTTSD